MNEIKKIELFPFLQVISPNNLQLPFDTYEIICKAARITPGHLSQDMVIEFIALRSYDEMLAWDEMDFAKILDLRDWIENLIIEDPGRFENLYIKHEKEIILSKELPEPDKDLLKMPEDTE